MLIYGILAGAIFIFYFVLKKSKNGEDRYFRWILAVLFCVSSFRSYSMGEDYLRYIDVFRTVCRVGYITYFEKGYMLLNVIASLFSKSYVALAIAVNLLIFFPFYWYINRFVESKYKLHFGGYIGYGSSKFDFLLFVVFIYAAELFFLLNYAILYQNEKEKFFVDLYLLSLALLPVFVKNDISYRIYIMLVFITLPAVPLMWKAFKRKGKKLEYILVAGGYSFYYLVFSVIFFYEMLMQRNYKYTPFEFFWQRPFS